MKGFSFSFSLAWVSFLNISIFALTVCVLSGCRNASQGSYSLINCNQDTLETLFGEDCGNASISSLPQTYKVGLSGVCRVKDGVSHCSNNPTRSFDFGQIILADIHSLNTTEGPNHNSTLNSCRSFIETKSGNSGLVHRLANVLLALLLVSIVLNIASLITSAVTGSAFGIFPFIPLLLDAITLTACIGIYFAILEHGLGDYSPTGQNPHVNGMHILGVGFWMLVAIFGCRIISHPALTILFIVLLLLIPVLFLFLMCLVFRCTACLEPVYKVTFFYY